LNPTLLNLLHQERNPLLTLRLLLAEQTKMKIKKTPKKKSQSDQDQDRIPEDVEDDQVIAEEPLEARDEELLEVLHLEEIEGNLLPQFRKKSVWQS